MISLLASAALAATPPKVEAAGPISIGESYVSEVLGAEHMINVILPIGYEDRPGEAWPVVVVLDGGRAQDLMLAVGIERWNRLWMRSQEAIIVGIETNDRQRELLPPTRDPAEAERYPTAGESAAFREWMLTSILPMIKEQYRGNGITVLIGESAAGHFVLETWATESEAFTGYAAISPSLQWDHELLSRSLAKGDEPKPPLYLSLADEGGATEAGMERLLAKLGQHQPYCFSDRRGDLKHSNSFHGVLPEALQFLLPTDADWLGEYGLLLRCEQSGALAS